MVMDKKMIEEVIGLEIPLEIYEKSVEAANRKLQSIIQHFGDCNGVCRTPGYMAELVMEADKSELLTENTLTLALADREHTFY